MSEADCSTNCFESSDYAALVSWRGRMCRACYRQPQRSETSLAIIADWIEDDMDDRVKDVRRHWISAHRLHEDDVYHFLTLMRCYRDGRKNKSPLPPPTL